MRLVFMGTPAYAVGTLDALCAAGHEVAGVFTQPDAPRGRGKKLLPSFVKERAAALRIPVYTPISTRREMTVCLEILESLSPEVIVVIAYGQILPEEILKVPPFGCVNLHASLLPRWRGAAPIQRAILAGDKTTGVTAMQMAAGLDTGDILLAEETPILDTDTSETLRGRLSEISARVIVRTLPLLESGALTPQKQDDALATKAEKITKEMSRLCFEDEPAQALDRRIRALTGFCFQNGRRLKFLNSSVQSGQTDAPPGTVIDHDNFVISCEGGTLLSPAVIQAEGGRPLAKEDFLRGFPLKKGDRLSANP